MTLLYLFIEFFKIGLFAVGGGLATIPFLMEITERYDWFTKSELANMLAISQSTPGPIGVNMATYSGYNAGGFLGGLVATLALVLPSIIVIIIIAHFFEKFKTNQTVQDVFFGVRPAVTGLIAASVISLFEITFFSGGSVSVSTLSIPMLVLAVILFIMMNIKKMKHWHPIVWLLIAAVVGVVFRF